MDKLSIKFQIFNSICMSNLENTTPKDILDLTQAAYEYMVADLEDDDRPSATLHTVN